MVHAYRDMPRHPNRTTANATQSIRRSAPRHWPRAPPTSGTTLLQWYCEQALSIWSDGRQHNAAQMQAGVMPDECRLLVRPGRDPIPPASAGLINSSADRGLVLSAGQQETFQTLSYSRESRPPERVRQFGQRQIVYDVHISMWPVRNICLLSAQGIGDGSAQLAQALTGDTQSTERQAVRHLTELGGETDWRAIRAHEWIPSLACVLALEPMGKPDAWTGRPHPLDRLNGLHESARREEGKKKKERGRELKRGTSEQRRKTTACLHDAASQPGQVGLRASKPASVITIVIAS